MSAGALFASSALPSLADDPDLFPKRGRWERLSLQFQKIDAGATKPFTLLHVSDTHLTAVYPHESEWTRKQSKRRTRTFGGRQEEALRDTIAWAKEHVDYVLHTGDLIDFQSEANFDLVRKYFGDAGRMMFGCVGNHEFYHGQVKKAENDSGKAKTRETVAAAFPFDISLQSTVINGVNFVTIDNVYDAVSAEQAARFEAEVKKGLPIILCMHCPIVTRGIRYAALRFWRKAVDAKLIPDMGRFKESYKDGTTSDFVAYLRAQPLLKGILCGHGHYGIVDRFSATANQYMVAANFLFHGQEITIA